MSNDSTVFVTCDGDTHWLECFADDMDGEHGDPFCPISAGDTWADLVAAVAAHEYEHRGCVPRTEATR